LPFFLGNRRGGNPYWDLLTKETKVSKSYTEKEKQERTQGTGGGKKDEANYKRPFFNSREEFFLCAMDNQAKAALKQSLAIFCGCSNTIED
jgi:hypothetical protein